MTIGWQEQLRPGLALRAIVTEATRALIAMDADRLEELARCCADLNREIEQTGTTAEAASDLRIAAQEVQLLGQVLVETRANLTVLTRLHRLRIREHFEAAADFTQPLREIELRWKHTERTAEYGDN